MPTSATIELMLHERAGDAVVPIDDVNFGSLLGNLGGRDYSHVLSVEYRRTQEIELIATLLVAGATAVTASYLKTLGEEFAKWTVEELKRRKNLRNARIEAGRKRILVSRNGEKKAARAIADLFAEMAKRKGSIEIVFEGRRYKPDIHS
jgi:hypothetical protein